MAPSSPRLDADEPRPALFPRWWVTRKEPTMTKALHHSVLRKIAARRTRIGRADAPPARVPFVTGSASQPGTPAQLAVLGGPRRLTQRELQVLHLVATAEPHHPPAERPSATRPTINCHAPNTLAKLEVPSPPPAAMSAARIGLL